jgi:hypothetical protein
MGIKGLAGDGVTKYYGQCNFCGKTDCLAPVHGIYLCPRCLGKGVWSSSQVRIVKSGYCDFCGVHFVGAGVYIPTARACFRCLWTRLGRHKDALRVEGRHIV